ncbi:hypothetical protein D3C81_1814320 [compost metagenome]
MIGIDPHLKRLPYLKTLRRLHLHAPAGQVQTHRRDHLAFVQQAHLGIDTHADEIAFFGVVGGRLGHAASFPLGCTGRLSYNSR